MKLEDPYFPTSKLTTEPLTKAAWYQQKARHSEQWRSVESRRYS